MHHVRHALALVLPLAFAFATAACSGETAPQKQTQSSALDSDGKDDRGPAQPVSVDDYKGQNPKEADASKELTLSNDGACIATEDLTVPNVEKLAALCTAPAVALAVKSEIDGCKYGEVKSVTFRCFTVDPSDGPPPPSGPEAPAPAEPPPPAPNP